MIHGIVGHPGHGDGDRPGVGVRPGHGDGDRPGLGARAGTGDLLGDGIVLMELGIRVVTVR